MKIDKIFKTMFFDIWQGNNIKMFDSYYAKDFKEVITVTDVNQSPIEINMIYNELLKEAHRYKDEFQDVTLTIKKMVIGNENHLSVNFYSSATEKKSAELKHRCVCGIWHFNNSGKIDRVWAVVTPYYQ